MMHEPTENDQSYLVHHFEMGTVNDGIYSNIAFNNDEASAGNTTHICGCINNPEDANSPKSTSLCHCAENLKREIFYDTVDRNEVLGIDKRDGGSSGEVHSPWFALHDRYDQNFSPSRSKDKNSSAVQSYGGVYVNLTDKQDCLRKGARQQQQGRKQNQQPDLAAGASPGTPQHLFSSRCCGSSRLVVLLQVLIFFMAAVSLALVILIINGKIACSEDTERDAAKPEKLTDLSSQFQKMQVKISKLKEELDNAQRELKELKDKSDLGIEELRRELQQMRNSAQQGITVNNGTVQVNQSSKKVDFELMLNTSQRRVMMTLTDMWASVNKTDKELREETRSLRVAANSTQREIEKVSNSLVKLTAKVHSEEKRSNETIQLQESHSNEITSLEMLINSSRQDMMNKMSQMWSSVNSTEKDLQEHTTVSLLAVWGAINDTKTELQQKLNSISKMAGPIGPPGFNGTQGRAGPAGPAGAPGPKGAGDFSACQYKQVTETLTPGSSVATANLAEPKGSIVIGATCSTNFAAEYNLVTTFVSNTWKYICNCKGTSKLFSPVGGRPKTCYLHYWLCPKT